MKPHTMDVETVVKIEGYSIECQQENDNGQAQSDEIKPAVSLTPVTSSPEPNVFHQNYDSGSTTAIAFHSEIGTALNSNQIVNAGESPLTITKGVKKEASAEEKFKCFIPNCSKSFANKGKLNIHLKFDHRKNWFKCHLCESAFPIEFVSKNHLATHPTEQQYVCNVCSKLCKNIPDLRKHEREVHEVANKLTHKSRSEIAPPLQRCSESAKIIMLRKTPRPILPKISLVFSFGVTPSGDIALCSESSTEKRELVNHGADPLTQPGTTIRRVKAGRKKEEALVKEKYECVVPNCPYSFANKWKLQSHLKNRHQQNWGFKCHLCRRICSKMSTLKAHLVSHSTARPHNCNVCSKTFKYITDLRKHERIVHQISSSSTKKRELAKHEPDLLLQTQPQMSSTTTTLNLTDSANEIEAELVLVDPNTAPEAPLLKVNPTNKCDVCLKTFKSRCLLGKHRKMVHAAENEKQFKCHICPKSFVVRPRLKQHLYFVHGEISENLKILECEFCQQEFPSVSRLETHIVAKHVVDKEFECSVCSKTFVDQDTLTKHQVKFHEQTTINHFCDVCSAGFTGRANLYSHLKQFHKRLYCHKCGRSFENKSELKQHLNSEATNNLKAGLRLKCQVCFVLLSTQCNFNIHCDGHSKVPKLINR